MVLFIELLDTTLL